MIFLLELRVPLCPPWLILTYWTSPRVLKMEINAIDLPNKETYKVLEKRKQFLLTLDQSQCSDEKKYYINAEIDALTKTINFTKFCLSKIPDETMAKIKERRNELIKAAKIEEKQQILECVEYYLQTPT